MIASFSLLAMLTIQQQVCLFQTKLIHVKPQSKQTNNIILVEGMSFKCVSPTFNPRLAAYSYLPYLIITIRSTQHWLEDSFSSYLMNVFVVVVISFV